MAKKNNPEEKPEKKVAHADKVEVDRRVTAVLNLLLQGAQHYDIQQYAAAEGWGIKERQICEYIARAREFLVEPTRLERECIVEQHVAVRWRLYQTCVQAGDLTAALKVVQDLGELQNIYPAKAASTVVVREQPKRTAQDLTDEELVAIIRAGEEKEKAA